MKPVKLIRYSPHFPKQRGLTLSVNQDDILPHINRMFTPLAMQPTYFTFNYVKAKWLGGEITNLTPDYQNLPRHLVVQTTANRALLNSLFTLPE